ncbi:MAG: hypothetical protein EPN48_18470 [Microbacteriaceae bacterium]|nr:MAG: hypothetical protein EPN48_18470 [Microbacteriaceae bacterium]
MPHDPILDPPQRVVESINHLCPGIFDHLANQRAQKPASWHPSCYTPSAAVTVLLEEQYQTPDEHGSLAALVATVDSWRRQRAVFTLPWYLHQRLVDAPHIHAPERLLSSAAETDPLGLYIATPHARVDDKPLHGCFIATDDNFDQTLDVCVVALIAEGWIVVRASQESLDAGAARVARVRTGARTAVALLDLGLRAALLWKRLGPDHLSIAIRAEGIYNVFSLSDRELTEMFNRRSLYN